MNLTISIVVHNRKDLTQKCVESIYEHTKIPFNLVITDNASTDGTLEWLMKLAESKPISIRINEGNLGFSRPHNEAFRLFESEFFCVLNNDLEVVPNWAETMLGEFTKDALLAQVGIKRSCSALDENGQGVPTLGEPEYAEGSCMVVRSEIVKGVPGGLFDPIYKFAYYEDSDLSLRLKRAGYKISVVDLPIIHIGAATAKITKGVDLPGYQLRNKHIFIDRWGTYLKGRVAQRISKDRIVIRRAGARGDVIMTTPIVRALRKTYPKSYIVVSTVCPEIYDQNPDVNDITIQGTPLRPTDLTFDLDMAYEKRPMVHPMRAYADVVGLELDDWIPRLYPTSTARTVALQRLPDGPKYALIHAGHIYGWVGRQWPWKNFEAVVQNLRERGYKTVAIGAEDSPNPKADLEFKNIPFTHLIALMERASIFVGLDSMPFWVAQATQTPSVVLFGCVDPELRIVPGGRAVGVTADGVGCLGCNHWLPAPRTATKACPRGEDYCMTKLEAIRVIAGIDEVEKRYVKNARR